jgi:hypothetical protein
VVLEVWVAAELVVITTSTVQMGLQIQAAVVVALALL